MMCNMNFHPAFDCPFGQCFNEATGACEDAAGSTLPPGIAPGRPFMASETTAVPLFAAAIEQTAFDLVGAKVYAEQAEDL
jgi:hypothetical protein